MNNYDIKRIKRIAGKYGEDVIRKLKKAPRKTLMLGGLLLTLGVATILTDNDSDNKQETKQEQIKDISNENQQVINIKDNKIDKDFEKYLDQRRPMVIKVEPTGYTYAEIYKTIDYIKELATTYDINFPILFDIETLIDNSTIRANCLLAEEFCNKLTANGFYVGLYGTEESMEKFEAEFSEVTGTHSIDLYDKLVVYAGIEPEYTGTFNMQQAAGESIEFKYDLLNIISKNNLNSPDKFISDQNYIIQSGEFLSDVASGVNMKTSD